MEATSRDIVLKILDHAIERGGAFRDWQVGLTSDIEARLTDKTIDSRREYTRFTASSPDQARQIAEMLCQIYGFEGNPCERNGPASVVFCHKKSGPKNS